MEGETARQSGQGYTPSRSKHPRQHIADERQARNENDQKPERIRIERAPRIDGLVRQEGKGDEGRDQESQARIDIVPAELGDEPVQRLFVGEDGGSDDAETDGKLAMTEHDHNAEQKHDNRGNLGGQPLAVSARPRRDDIARPDEGADDQEGGRQDPRGREGSRQPPGSCTEKRQQDEGAQSGDAMGFLLLGLALFTLDADECAEQDCRGEVERDR